MESVVGVGNANAWADRDAYAIHTIYPTDNHEVVHLFTSAWGNPVALINEGTAVAFQVDPGRDLTPRWSGTPLHDLARQLSWFKPGHNTPAPKQTFVRKAQFGQETYIVGSGIYKQE